MVNSTHISHQPDARSHRRQLDQLQAQIDALPAECRVVLTLRLGLIGERWTHSEVAWALETSERRVRRIEERALELLGPDLWMGAESA